MRSTTTRIETIIPADRLAEAFAAGATGATGTGASGAGAEAVSAGTSAAAGVSGAFRGRADVRVR